MALLVWGGGCLAIWAVGSFRMRSILESFFGSFCSQPTLPARAMQTQFANCRAARRNRVAYRGQRPLAGFAEVARGSRRQREANETVRRRVKAQPRATAGKGNRSKRLALWTRFPPARGQRAVRGIGLRLPALHRGRGCQLKCVSISRPRDVGPARPERSTLKLNRAPRLKKRFSYFGGELNIVESRRRAKNLIPSKNPSPARLIGHILPVGTWPIRQELPRATVRSRYA